MKKGSKSQGKNEERWREGRKWEGRKREGRKGVEEQASLASHIGGSMRSNREQDGIFRNKNQSRTDWVHNVITFQSHTHVHTYTHSNHKKLPETIIHESLCWLILCSKTVLNSR